MVAGCGNNVLKYILLFLNFLVFVMSLIGVIVSLVFILEPGSLEKAGSFVKEFNDINTVLSPQSIRLGLYVILGASVVILIISFLGCCGAWKEIKFLLGLYAIILLIILIAEVAAFILAIVFKNKVESKLKEGLQKAKSKNSTIYGDFEKIVECCGVEDGDKCINTKLDFKIGCYNKVIELVKSFYTIVLAVSVITVIIEILLISFSCCLCSNIGEKTV